MEVESIACGARDTVESRVAHHARSPGRASRRFNVERRTRRSQERRQIERRCSDGRGIAMDQVGERGTYVLYERYSLNRTRYTNLTQTVTRY